MKTKTLLPVYGEEKTSGTDFLKCSNLHQMQSASDRKESEVQV